MLFLLFTHFNKLRNTDILTVSQLYRGCLSFIDGGKRSSERQPPKDRKSLINFIIYGITLYRVHLATGGNRTHNID